jgi:hypothetical protein
VIAISEKVPASMPISSSPPKSASPPPAVMTSDWSAALRASADVELKPIRKKEIRLVISLVAGEGLEPPTRGL